MNRKMKTVLVIDNFKSHRLLLKEELQEEGYGVIAAAGISQALSLRRAAPVDLIVLEVRLKDAREKTFQALRARYPQALWVGYSTSLQCPEEQRRWVHFFLPKSSELAPLKRLIKRVLPPSPLPLAAEGPAAEGPGGEAGHFFSRRPKGFSGEDFLPPAKELSLPPMAGGKFPEP